MSASAALRFDRDSEYTVRINGVTTYAGTVCAFPAAVDVTGAPEYKVCADAVAWAVANNVTNGTSATTFSPKNVCTRGQVVTFLYRAKN